MELKLEELRERSVLRGEERDKEKPKFIYI
jgi:hypothetical protein